MEDPRIYYVDENEGVLYNNMCVIEYNTVILDEICMLLLLQSELVIPQTRIHDITKEKLKTHFEMWREIPTI